MAMASKTLNAKNLEALGAARLAEMLMRISEGNAVAKRQLRLELASLESPAKAASEIRKRLQSIRRARSHLDWQAAKAVASDLEAQRRAIVEKIAPSNPSEALDLLWQFLDTAHATTGTAELPAAAPRTAQSQPRPSACSSSRVAAGAPLGLQQAAAYSLGAAGAAAAAAETPTGPTC